MLRRTHPGKQANIVYENLNIDLYHQTVELQLDNSTIGLSLTPLEFKLLVTLIGYRTKFVSREKLTSEIWGNTVHLSERTIDTHMSKLRKKLEPSRIKIKNRRGLGYCLIQNKTPKLTNLFPSNLPLGKN